LVEIVAVQIHCAEISANPCIVGFLGEVTFIILDRFRVLFEVGVDIPHAPECVEVVRRKLENMLERFERGTAITRLDLRGPELHLRE
jgi:hypothetical protein